MKQYYHATSYENALKIVNNGFLPSSSGMLGAGIYFAETPKSAEAKARYPIINAIVVVTLNTGQIKTEQFAKNWTLSSLKNAGYGAVQMTRCRTGTEICVFETSRITILGFVHWDSTNITFKQKDGFVIEMDDFQHLTRSRKTSICDMNGKTYVEFSGVTFQNMKISISSGSNTIYLF